jgi:hypothetical protein
LTPSFPANTKSKRTPQKIASEIHRAHQQIIQVGARGGTTMHNQIDTEGQERLTGERGAITEDLQLLAIVQGEMVADGPPAAPH